MSYGICNELNESWNLLTELCLSQCSLPSRDVFKCNDLTETLSVIERYEFTSIFHKWYYETFRCYLCDNLLPQFWTSLPSNELSNGERKSYDLLFESYSHFNTNVKNWIENAIIKSSFNGDDENYGKYQKKMKSLLRALLLSDAPLHFNEYLIQTYSAAFKVNQNVNRKSLVSNDSFHNQQSYSCHGCESIANECRCKTITESFACFNSQLREMQLLGILVDDAVTSVMHSCIENHIQNKCQGNFDVSCIDALKDWIDKTVIEWVRFVYGYSRNEKQMSHLEERLNYFLYETYAHFRMEQLFDIIIEFPDSEPSLADLRQCLEKCVNFRPKLIKSLKESIESRLLHPGVSTSDILAAYISAIKALRVLDSTGVILQLVCEPVRRYLKSRDDTVRCIITALTADTSSELTPEFVKTQNPDDVAYNSDDENITENWQQWNPDPIDATQESGASKSLRSLDIVSILVNIYESKDLFVEEYQRLLGQRLLTNFECNMEHERRNLELLTLRFGESDLHSCEVMLKDVTSSKRISQRINSGEIEAYKFENFPINALILSAQFWPEKIGLSSNEDVNNLKLPPEVLEGTDIFNKAFETIKGSRTLNWMSHLGVVQLELEFDDRKLTFSVPPSQATIIWHFQEKQCWTIPELSEVMSVPPSVLRRRITFWQNKGILKETKVDRFVLIEDQRTNASQSSHANENTVNMDADFDDDLTDEKITISSHDANEEKFAVYWSFVHNMLNNLNSLPLEKIHTMLQMFAIQGHNSSDQLTAHQLRHFLDSKVKEHALAYSGGQYRLPESNTS